jgi:hypothetical protein
MNLQIMMEHQRVIEKLKYELAAYEQKAVQERNFWNTQRSRVEVIGIIPLAKRLI